MLPRCMIGKYIQFNDADMDADNDFFRGQVAKIVAAREVMLAGTGESAYELRLQFRQWREFNDGLDPGTYFDDQGQATRRWSQTEFYPENGETTVYISPDQSLWNFDFLEERVALALADGADAVVPGGQYEECLRWIRKALDDPSPLNLQMARLHMAVLEGHSPARLRAEVEKACSAQTHSTTSSCLPTPIR